MTKWTPEEVDVIRAYPRLSNHELTELLIDKTAKQISRKRILLNIQSPKKFLDRRVKCKIGDRAGSLTLEQIIDNGDDKYILGKFSCKCDSDKCRLYCTYRLQKVFGKNSDYVGCGASRLSFFDDYEEIKGITWTRIIYSAKDRNIPFDIKIEEAWEIYIKQDRCCALSGWPIGFEYKSNNGKCKRKRRCSASLDRINPKLGYTVENCQWLDWEINLLKNKWPQDRFIEICGAIYKHKEQLGGNL